MFHLAKISSRPTQGFIATDYKLPIESLNVAEIALGARYPARGFLARNKKSDMIVRILFGQVEFLSDGQETRLSKGDVVLIRAGIAYYWRPAPNVSLFVVSIPPWKAEDHEIIPDDEGV